MHDFKTLRDDLGRLSSSDLILEKNISIITESFLLALIKPRIEKAIENDYII